MILAVEDGKGVQKYGTGQFPGFTYVCESLDFEVIFDQKQYYFQVLDTKHKMNMMISLLTKETLYNENILLKCWNVETFRNIISFALYNNTQTKEGV